MWLIGLSAVAAAIVGTVVAMGGRVEAATWGLVVAAAAMVFALHSLYRMAGVLSRPAVEVVLEQDDVAQLAGVRELREERRRVLRAINELQFDYEMGKLSEEDFQAVREGYQLRAVEVMRALDAGPELHPDLEAELHKRGLSRIDDGASDEKASDEDEASDDVKASSDENSEPSASDDAEASDEAKASSDDEDASEADDSGDAEASDEAKASSDDEDASKVDDSGDEKASAEDAPDESSDSAAGEEKDA